MKLWNKGGEWRRSTGEVIAYAQVFEATDREVMLMTKRRQLGIRFIEVAKVAPPAPKGGKSGDVDSVKDEAALLGLSEEAVRPEGGAPSGDEPEVKADTEVVAEEELKTPEAQSAPEVSDESPEVKPETESKPPLAPEWTLKMSPELYIKLHPEGPHAAKAQQVIAAKAAGGANGSDE